MKHCLIVCTALLFLSGCGPKGQETWFAPKFNLITFLKEKAPQAFSEITFQVCDADKKPLPYGLLRFDWEDNGGRMSFQTDADGKIAMKFEEDILESEVLVSIDRKPRGQSFMKTENYDSSTEAVPNGHIRVTW